MQVSDITAAVQAMPERKSLLEVRGSSIFPVFGQSVAKLLLLMEWRLFLPVASAEEKKSWLRCYAALIPHGKIFVAETFFSRCDGESDQNGNYLGSAGVFSVKYPDNIYDATLDNQVADLLAQQLHFQVAKA